MWRPAYESWASERVSEESILSCLLLLLASASVGGVEGGYVSAATSHRLLSAAFLHPSPSDRSTAREWEGEGGEAFDAPLHPMLSGVGAYASVVRLEELQSRGLATRSFAKAGIHSQVMQVEGWGNPSLGMDPVPLYCLSVEGKFRLAEALDTCNGNAWGWGGGYSSLAAPPRDVDLAAKLSACPATHLHRVAKLALASARGGESEGAAPPPPVSLKACKGWRS